MSARFDAEISGGAGYGLRRVIRAIQLSVIAATIPFAANAFADNEDTDIEPGQHRAVAYHHAGERRAEDSTGRPGLHVAHLDCGREWRGGQNQVLLLMRALRERGARNLLIAHPGPLLDRASAECIPALPWQPRGDWDGIAVLRTASMLRAQRVHVVHSHDARSHAIGVPAARLAGARAILVSRRVAFSTAGNPLSALKYRMPVDRYLCVSRSVMGHLREAGVPEKRLALVPDGFDLGSTATAFD